MIELHGIAQLGIHFLCLGNHFSVEEAPFDGIDIIIVGEGGKRLDSSSVGIW